jgi:hypothetical protein
MVPRVRRAVEGAGATEVLTDDAVKDLVADSLAAIILYTNNVFGKSLLVTDQDSNDAPTEYAVDPELSLPEQTVIAAQAALDFFFHEFRDKKVSESIADEAQTWDYTLSATLLRDQLKLLSDERDKALEAIMAQGVALESYTSFLAVQDALTSALIEPWVDPVFQRTRSIPFGQEDFRFGVLEPPFVGPTNF